MIRRIVRTAGAVVALVSATLLATAPAASADTDNDSRDVYTIGAELDYKLVGSEDYVYVNGSRGGPIT